MSGFNPSSHDLEKRALLAVLLTVLVWAGWQYRFSIKTDAKKTPLPAAQKQETQPVTKVPSLDFQSGAQEQVFSYENDVVSVQISSRGGGIKQWALKKYSAIVGKKEEKVELIPPDSLWFLVGSPLVEVGLTPYEAFERVATGDINTLHLQFKKDAILIERIYQFDPNGYSFTHHLHIIAKDKILSPATFISAIPLKEKLELYPFSPNSRDTRVLGLAHGKTETERLSAIKASRPWTAQNALFAGLDSRYFLIAAIANQDQTLSFQIERNDEKNEWFLSTTLSSHAPQTELNFENTFFLGPKEKNTLERASHDLSEAIDFGWFGVFAFPLLYILNFFYGFFGNYGVAIILLTIMIKMLFLPLSQKSLKSMKELQRIQPQIQLLKEKHKDDRERLNREMMNLMKTNNVNPLGGCLPLLFQMPIFFALYRVLYNAIELYHAPFFGWIRDLSSKDPYYISPIILGIAMLVQQKMTPSTGDPTQAKMMLMMPIFFTALMLYLPAGLVLYILVNTLLTIAHQYVMVKADTTKG